jgi:hypothetical protein
MHQMTTHEGEQPEKVLAGMYKIICADNKQPGTRLGIYI